MQRKTIGAMGYRVKPDTVEGPAVGVNPKRGNSETTRPIDQVDLSQMIQEEVREADANDVTHPQVAPFDSSYGSSPTELNDSLSHIHSGRNDPTLVDMPVFPPQTQHSHDVAAMTAEEIRAHEEQILHNMDQFHIRDTYDSMPRIRVQRPAQPYNGGVITALPDGPVIETQLVYRGGLSEQSSAIFDLVDLLNASSGHPAYRGFRSHSHDGRGLLAMAYTDTGEVLTDDAANRDVLSMNFFENFREKFMEDGVVSTMLPISAVKNSLSETGFDPQLYFYIKAKTVGHEHGRPLFDYSLWLLDAGTPEGCSVTLPLYSMDSPEAKEAGDIFADNNPTEAIFEMKKRFLGRKFTPNNDCYKWPIVNRAMAHFRDATDSFIGFSLDAFLANYFRIGKLLDPAFAEVSSSSDPKDQFMLDEYRQTVQAMQGSVVKKPTVTLYSRVNSSLLVTSNKIRPQDTEGNVILQPNYEPGDSDVRIRHFNIGSLGMEEWEATIAFGERLDPAFGPGLDKEYACQLKLSYKPF